MTTIVKVYGKGPRGDRGPQGPSGGAASSFVHNQAGPAATWIVSHNLGFNPNVQAFDNLGNQIEGEVKHDSVNQARILFDTAVAGQAFLS